MHRTACDFGLLSGTCRMWLGSSQAHASRLQYILFDSTCLITACEMAAMSTSPAAGRMSLVQPLRALRSSSRVFGVAPLPPRSIPAIRCTAHAQQSCNSGLQVGCFVPRALHLIHDSYTGIKDWLARTSARIHPKKSLCELLVETGYVEVLPLACKALQAARFNFWRGIGACEECRRAPQHTQY